MLKLAKRKTVTPPVLDRVRRRLTRRLFRACSAAEGGDCQRFLIGMMNVYQNLISDLGLVGYWVVPIACTNHGIDALMIGCPDGGVLDIPDPSEDLDQVVELFLTLASPLQNTAMTKAPS